MLASGSVDQTIRIWDIRRQNSLMILDRDNAVNPRLNKLKFRDLKDKARMRHVQSHSGSISALQFTHDGQHLLSAGTDRCVRIFLKVLSLLLLMVYGAHTKYVTRFKGRITVIFALR